MPRERPTVHPPSTQRAEKLLNQAMAAVYRLPAPEATAVACGAASQLLAIIADMAAQEADRDRRLATLERLERFQAEARDLYEDLRRHLSTPG